MLLGEQQKRVESFVGCLANTSRNQDFNPATVHDFVRSNSTSYIECAHQYTNQRNEKTYLSHESKNKQFQGDGHGYVQENSTFNLGDIDFNRRSDSNIPEDETSNFSFQFNNVIMFPQSDLTVNHVMEMLLGCFIQFNVVVEAREKLVSLIKILAGPFFKNLNLSNYFINKTLNTPEENTTFHYYCFCFWPISIVFNELPPNIRFKHILLVGILIVSKEPSPELLNLFIEKFKDQATGLHNTGMKYTFSEDGIKRSITFTPLCVIADSPAKATLQNKVRHNGYNCCPYCY